MKDYILDPQILENFCKDFIKKIRKYQLSYYIKDKGSTSSRENIIHSAIIWSREAINRINSSPIITKESKDIIDLLTLINLIDLLLESTHQIYRVLYFKEEDNFCLNKKLIFRNLPEQYSNLNNIQCFKEIRAMFSSHPINLSEPRENKKRFADIPCGSKTMIKLRNYDCDFYIRLWTATKKDKDTIYFKLYIDDLIEFSQMIYSYFPTFQDRVNKIANKKIY